MRSVHAPLAALVLLVLAPAGLVAPLAAAVVPTGASISGVVLDASNAQPVEGAAVRLRGTDYQVATDAGGRFVLVDVNPGTYVLETQHIAYATRSDSIVVERGEEMALEVRLSATALDLKPLVVSVHASRLRSVGFYDRKKMGIGIFITRDDIEARHIRRVSDLLSSVPGLHRTLRKDGMSNISMRGVKTIVTDCTTQYFLDGVPSHVGIIGIDVVPPADIAGIEIYKGSSELPTQFDVGRAMCGAILIWTRDGAGK